MECVFFHCPVCLLQTQTWTIQLFEHWSSLPTQNDFQKSLENVLPSTNAYTKLLLFISSDFHSIAMVWFKSIFYSNQSFRWSSTSEINIFRRSMVFNIDCHVLGRCSICYSPIYSTNLSRKSVCAHIRRSNFIVLRFSDVCNCYYNGYDQSKSNPSEYSTIRSIRQRGKFHPLRES